MFITITSKDSCGPRIDNINIHRIEGFSYLNESRYIINTTSGYQYFVDKKFCEKIEFNNKRIAFENLPELIKNGGI